MKKNTSNRKKEKKKYIKIYGVSVLLIILDWKAPRVFPPTGGK